MPASKERGAADILVYIAVFTILWTVFYWVTTWIYTTKEDRLHRNWENAVQSKKVHYNVQQTGASFYTVKCSGLFEKKCR